MSAHPYLMCAARTHNAQTLEDLTSVNVPQVIPAMATITVQVHIFINLGRLIVSADIRQELSRITCA